MRQDVNEREHTISESIKFNVDTRVPKKTVKQYANNNKPWISSELRRQIVNKHKAFTKEPEDYNIKHVRSPQCNKESQKGAQVKN